MLKSKYLAGTSAVAFAALLAGGASAQTAANAPATNVEEVVVTGSFIAGTPKDTAIPVAVIGQEELERRGQPSILEIIKGLPISGPVLGDSNQFSVNAQGRSGGGTINIRGLGAQRTLVLVNGRRFAGGTADTNLIPVAAIGRIEILKDGAAATYGSDAIAGVANFITRKNFSGIEVQGDYRYVPGSDGDFTASVLYGWVGDTSNLLLSVGYQRRSELSTTDRKKNTLAPYLDNPSGWSVLGNPGAYTIRGGAAGTTALGFAVDANCAAVGGTPNFTGTTPACYFSYLPFDNLVEEEDRYQVYGEFNADVFETGKFHVEAFYTQTSIPWHPLLARLSAHLGAERTRQRQRLQRSVVQPRVQHLPAADRQRRPRGGRQQRADDPMAAVRQRRQQLHGRARRPEGQPQV
jgi:iron complex outermembrane receptor protein